MPASKVYFTDFRCRNGVSQLDKLRKLLEKSEFSQIDFDGKFVAIKLHFGELGNLSFLRANYAKVVADFIKERGGRPFITDCNTLYVGSRKNALEHMDTAYLNGYSPFSTGCHVIIADGLKGSDDIEVPVAGGEYCKTARIGRAVMDADIVISLAHFKGHEEAGFGGALKNIGMGCGSRAGKMAMHADGKPYVETDLRRLRRLREDLRAQRPADRKQKVPDRSEQLRRLRPLHRGLSQGRHPSDFPSQCQAPQLQDCGIRQGRAGRSSQLLHQHCPRRFAELRLPPGKRRPHCPGRRDVRIRRPRRAGSGLRRGYQPSAGSSKQRHHRSEARARL